MGESEWKIILGYDTAFSKQNCKGYSKKLYRRNEGEHVLSQTMKADKSRTGKKYEFWTVSVIINSSKNHQQMPKRLGKIIFVELDIISGIIP